MIKITRDGTQVKIEVESQYPLTKTYLFYWECGREDFAIMLRDNLNSSMNKALERLKTENYNHGWKDAKAKVKKTTWFSGWW
jgi:hypothetical protein